MAEVPPSRGGQIPDPGRFVNPWQNRGLVHYLAHLRRRYGALPIAGEGGWLSVDDLFVQPRLARRHPVDGPPRSLSAALEALTAERRMVVVGGPGAGRSTLLAWLIGSLTDPGRNAVTQQLGRMVPLPLEISRLRVDESVFTIDALLQWVQAMPYWNEALHDALPALLRRGQVLFAVDGFDELQRRSVREAIRDALLDGMWQYSSCCWLVTAGPGTYEDLVLRDQLDDEGDLPPSLAALDGARSPSLPAWSLAPFDGEQVRRFADLWRMRVGLGIGRVGSDRVGSGRVGSVSGFEAALGRSRPATAVSGHPALLVLLAQAYRRNPELPQSWAGVAGALVDAWLDLADTWPDGRLLDHAQYRRWLGIIACKLEASRLARSLEPAFSGRVGHRQAVAVFREVSGAPDNEMIARRFLEAMVRQPSLIAARDGDGIAFGHPRIQSALAASMVAASLEQPQAAGAAGALKQLRSWSRKAGARSNIVHTLEALADRPKVMDQLVRELFGHAATRTLGELHDLGDLALELRDVSGVPLSAWSERVIERLLGQAVARWVELRGRAPTWVRDLSALPRTDTLSTLDLSGCTELVDVSSLASCAYLQRLDLHGCGALSELSPITGLSMLRWLDLRDCRRLTDLRPLSKLTDLRWLDLGGCTALTDITALGCLDDLHALVLSNCQGLRSLAPLSGMRSLRALVLSGCRNLTDLSPLMRLPPGGYVWIKGSGVRNVPADFPWTVVGSPSRGRRSVR